MMRVILMTIVAAVIPGWIASTVARACEEPSASTPAVLFVSDDEAEGGTQRIVVTATGEKPGTYAVAVGGPAGDGRSEDQMVWVDDSGAKHVRIQRAGKNGAWLGVSIANVPEALAEQLDLRGEGVLVTNVVKDSPADQAGLAANDVILYVNDEAVDADVTRAVNLIGAYKAGDVVDIVVLRDGREETVSATLGSRKDVKGGAFAWRFEVAPDAEVVEEIQTRGKMIRKTDDGDWVVEDLGNLAELPNLPEHVRMFMPKSGTASTQVFVHGDQTKVKMEVQRDGGTITITQDGEGPIAVTRADQHGDSDTQTYDTIDDLRDADSEAADLWEKAGDKAIVHLNIDGDWSFGDGLHFDNDLQFDVDVDSKEWQAHVNKWHEQLEQHLGDAHQAYEDAMAQLAEGAEGLHELKNIEELMPLFLDKHGVKGLPHAMALRQLGKPKHSFEARADGSIEVRIRKGDSELTQVFRDERDLANRKPVLYDKYRELMDLDERE